MLQQPFNVSLSRTRSLFLGKLRDSRRSPSSGTIRRYSSSTNGEENGNNSTLQQPTESKLKKTVADLDAILGIDEEEEEELKANQVFPEISEDTNNEIRSLAEEISQKLTKVEGEADDKKKEEFIEKMVKIVENATDNAVGNSGEFQFDHFANSVTS